jgi:chromosome partitioning protein
VAVANQKGGVGKTTTAVNVASYLALHGRRVLLVDFDPQANASSGMGIRDREPGKSIYEGVLGSVSALDLIKQSEVRNCHLIPSHPNLAGITIELLDKSDREKYLANFLKPIEPFYDYIFIDLPPSLSLLTINGLMAAREILIPVQCEYYGLEGLSQLLESVDLINHNLGHNLKIAGALLTMYDTREHLSREVSKELRRHFVGHVFEVEIPRAVALAEAPSFSKPICLYAPDSVGARAYERIAQELLQQEVTVT